MAEKKNEKKFCISCGAEMDLDSKFCSKCGGDSVKINNNQLPSSNNNAGSPRWVKILIIVLVILFVPIACTAGCTVLVGSAVDEVLSEEESSNNSSDTDNDYNDNANDSEDSDEDDFLFEDRVYSFGDSFKFDNLEITFGDKASFSKIKNQFSEYNGQSVVKIPVTIKNLKKETHHLNMFYYTLYGSTGVESDSVGYYFDDSISDAGDLRNGASYTKYFYILYDGDGTYAIEFDNYSQEITVEFEIKK